MLDKDLNESIVYKLETEKYGTKPPKDAFNSKVINLTLTKILTDEVKKEFYKSR